MHCKSCFENSFADFDTNAKDYPFRYNQTRQYLLPFQKNTTLNKESRAGQEYRLLKYFLMILKSASLTTSMISVLESSFASELDSFQAKRRSALARSSNCSLWFLSLFHTNLLRSVLFHGYTKYIKRMTSNFDNMDSGMEFYIINIIASK